MTAPTLHGAHVALVTPLTADRELHEPDIDRLVRRAADDGLAGVLVAGTTGEGALLTPEQRRRLTQLARRAADEAGGGITVLAGASGSGVPALHADVAALAEAGADAVLVLAPNLYPMSSEELVALHLDVAEHAEVLTLVYHLPQLTGSSLDPAALPELAAHPRIVGMKDSSHDRERRLAFIAAAAELGGFDVLTGDVADLREALLAGAAGSITAIANLRARAVVALHDAVARADEREAERHQARLASMAASLRAVGSAAAVTKAALQLDGAIEERWCAPPLGSVPPARLDHVRTALMP